MPDRIRMKKVEGLEWIGKKKVRPGLSQGFFLSYRFF
jgi:hypothetical protein